MNMTGSSTRRVVQTLKATSVVPIRLVYVGKHRLVCEGLVRSIATQSDLTVVGEAGGPNEAVRCFRCHQPDVTLVDLRWCGMAGIDAVRGVRSLSPTARIITIARSPADYTTLLALDAGVMGCVVNRSGLRELLRVIRAVHRGRPALPRGLDDALRARWVSQMLTPRQIEILQLIGGGLRNEAISIRLQISQQTVKAHVRGFWPESCTRSNACARPSVLAAASCIWTRTVQHCGMLQDLEPPRRAEEARPGPGTAYAGSSEPNMHDWHSEVAARARRRVYGRLICATGASAQPADRTVCELPFPFPPAATEARVLMVGNLHATHETPRLAAELTCTVARTDPPAPCHSLMPSRGTGSPRSLSGQRRRRGSVIGADIAARFFSAGRLPQA